MKGITATYRMTNKPLPVRHSPYVSGVLRPLKVSSLVLCTFRKLVLSLFPPVIAIAISGPFS